MGVPSTPWDRKALPGATKQDERMGKGLEKGGTTLEPR